MYCINCGKQLEDDMKFCIYCGARQEEEQKENNKMSNIIPERISHMGNRERKPVRNALLVLQDIIHEDRLYAADFQTPAILGRESRTCTMLIENDKSVSRKHCEFFWKNGICYVRDLESFNGTVLNGEKIKKPTPVREGDILKLGGTELVVAQCDIE